MSTQSTPIQSEDFVEAAGALATPPTGEAVATSEPIPTDRYLTPEDVAATKAAEAEASGTPVAAVVADPAAPAAVAAKDGTPAPVAAAKPVAGAPPEDRWDTILENARKKARADVESEYTWVKDLSRDDIEATRKWISLGNQNPLMALDQLVQGMIRSNPDQKSQIERYFKSILGEAGAVAAVAAAAAGAAASDADAKPGPDIPTDTSNGKPVVYSDAQMDKLLAWQAKQLRAEIRTEFEKDLAPIRNEREQLRIDTETTEYTNRAIGAISGLPGYEEYRTEIAQAYANIPTADNTRTEGEKLRDAYLQVVTSKMSEKARLEAIASVTRRAEAGTVNPSAQSAATPFDYKSASWEQALRHEFNTAALER